MKKFDYQLHPQSSSPKVIIILEENRSTVHVSYLLKFMKSYSHPHLVLFFEIEKYYPIEQKVQDFSGILEIVSEIFENFPTGTMNQN